MGPGPFLVGRTPHQKTHPGKKSPNCVFWLFFGNKKDARRPYDHFGGGIAPRSLLCVRKRKFLFWAKIGMKSLANSRRFFTFLRIFGHSMAFFGVRRGFKMILSHRAPSSLNMSSYRAIWTHFRPNFIFFGPKNLRLPKIQTFPKMQISSSSHSHKYLTYMGR